MTKINCFHMNCKFNSGFIPKDDVKDHVCTKDEIMVDRKLDAWTVAYCCTKEEME